MLYAKPLFYCVLALNFLSAYQEKLQDIEINSGGIVFSANWTVYMVTDIHIHFWGVASAAALVG